MIEIWFPSQYGSSKIKVYNSHDQEDFLIEWIRVYIFSFAQKKIFMSLFKRGNIYSRGVTMHVK